MNILLVWKYCGSLARTWYWVCAKIGEGLFGDTPSVPLTSECTKTYWIGKGIALSAWVLLKGWFLVLGVRIMLPNYYQAGSCTISCILAHSRMFWGALISTGQSKDLGGRPWWAIRGTWQDSAQSTSLCCSGECDMAKKEWTWILDQEICIFLRVELHMWINCIKIGEKLKLVSYWIWQTRSQC